MPEIRCDEEKSTGGQYVFTVDGKTDLVVNAQPPTGGHVDDWVLVAGVAEKLGIETQVLVDRLNAGETIHFD